ncbi:hypothetical protein [Geosporobacter ferrireducens]|uniref:hypothetical protein n=1 Tax=Geosporobacter ferrireducens TaxID=1424294 RepID=UPI00139D4497|nr:hypothetical protein [Geosporobacter ferrireducens]MTI53324.1 hypothetical protein [Geosporobacter ferrireducens]
MKNSMYSRFILQHVPTILTQIDRDEHSPTFGSCDRNFWHLKIRDFSSAILQQTSLTLALLYSVDFEGNLYYKNPNIYEWCLGTVRFWEKIQLKDGSFNEYYPNEHGFPPTAFSLFAVAETFKILKLSNSSYVDSMKKTAKYLIENIETKALNQEMASICALYSVYTLTNEDWILKGMKNKLSIILEKQSNEGWFPEYGGADFGYLSVTLDMLAEYYWQSKDDRVIKHLNKIVDFVKYFCHPDGSIGGEYGSRNTTYFLPNGLEVLIQLGNMDAANIKSNLLRKIDTHQYFQNSIDDRYFSHYVMHSFLRALQKENHNIDGDFLQLPCFNEHSRYFEECGLFTCKNSKYYMVVGIKKGGIIKVFDDNKEIFTDFGYRIKNNSRYVSVTNWLDEKSNIDINANSIRIKGSFTKIKTHIPTPFKHFILRIVAKLAGKQIINLLKKKLIFIDNHDNVEFDRRIIIAEKEINIIDHIEGKDKIDKLISANSFSMRHVASGKFFKTTDLMHKKRLEFSNIKSILIKQRLDLETGRVEIEHEMLG